MGLCWFGSIQAPGNWVEPLIALSIAVLAVENFFIREKNKPIQFWKLLLIAGFGLVHGMGFASALSESHAAFLKQNLLLSLFGFNVGVELGQLTIVFLMYWFVWRLFAKKDWYYRRVIKPASAIIGLIALSAFILRLS